MKKKNFSITNIGTVSLLMIFIILCMVTFAALSLSSAAADHRFSQKMADHSREYYDASGKAEAKLAEIDDVLDGAYQNGMSDDDYYQQIRENYPDISQEFTKEKPLISYQVDMNDSQAVFVQLKILPPTEIESTGSNSYYKIITWKEISTKEWKGDNSIKLIGEK